MEEFDYSDINNISESCDEVQWLFIGAIVFGIILFLGGMYVAKFIDTLGGLFMVFVGLILIVIGSILIYNHNEMCEQYNDDLKKYTDLLPNLKKTDYILTTSDREFIEELHDNYKQNTFEDLDDNYDEWKDVCYNYECDNGTTSVVDDKCVCKCTSDDYKGPHCNEIADDYPKEILESMKQCIDYSNDPDGVTKNLIPVRDCFGDRDWNDRKEHYSLTNEKDLMEITTKDNDKLECINPKFCKNTCNNISNKTWCERGVTNNDYYRGDDEDFSEWEEEFEEKKYKSRYNSYGVDDIPQCIDKYDDDYDKLKCMTHEKYYENYCKQKREKCNDHHCEEIGDKCLYKTSCKNILKKSKCNEYGTKCNWHKNKCHSKDQFVKPTEPLIPGTIVTTPNSINLKEKALKEKALKEKAVKEKAVKEKAVKEKVKQQSSSKMKKSVSKLNNIERKSKKKEVRDNFVVGGFATI